MMQQNCTLILLIVLICFVFYSLWHEKTLEFLRFPMNGQPKSINSSGLIIKEPETFRKSIDIGRTTCGRKAYEAGVGQNVISYTLYGNISVYSVGLNTILREIQRIYPGWFVRIYTNEPNSKYIVNLTYHYDYLHVCDVLNLPSPISSLEDYPEVMWRYFPLGDPQINVVLFRDIDSHILDREGAAVFEWLNKSNKSLHMMRDHPGHFDIIMGGMWGARMTSKNRELWESARNAMFEKAYKLKVTKQIDQLLLAVYVWHKFFYDSYSHDSFKCQLFVRSRPFPTQRVNDTFIGSPIFRLPNEKQITYECPLSCRPVEHSDWKYC